MSSGHIVAGEGTAG